MLGGRPLFVLFGSSIVQYSFSNGGWGAALADIYARKADILLRGYIGWNTRRAVQVMDKVFPKDSAVQPSLVIVYFGGNDSIAAHSSGLGPHVPLNEYIGNMRKIAEQLKSLSEKTRVIFLSCPPTSERGYASKLYQEPLFICSTMVHTVFQIKLCAYPSWRHQDLRGRHRLRALSLLPSASPAGCGAAGMCLGARMVVMVIPELVQWG